MDFGSGESLDDLHRSTALRAAPRIGEVFGAGTVLFGLRLLCRSQKLKAKGQERGAFAVGQEAEVTDAHKAFGRMCSKKRHKNSIAAASDVFASLQRMDGSTNESRNHPIQERNSIYLTPIARQCS